jgi:hypothetical protein
MLAIEATLQQGKLTLLEPLPYGVTSARVFILIDNGADLSSLPAANSFPALTPVEEEGFSNLALAEWVDEASDESTDWEEHFGLK